MLDIVVYEDKKDRIYKVIDSINLSFHDNNIDYRVYTYDSYNLEFDYFTRYNDNKKIYILDDEVEGVSGLEIATKIRKYDRNSVIIMIDELNIDVSVVFNLRLMILDLISIDDDYENRFIEDIKMAISILYGQDLFTFRYNSIVYRIPYNQIYYIEKEPAIKRCIIHTMEREYYINSSVNYILSHLNNDFCRTHQSCIVNLNNVREIDLSSNVIVFNNGDKIDMLTDKMKRVLKEYIGLI